MSIDIHDINDARARIAETAQRMLDGECAYIEGSRLIVGFLRRARFKEFEEPFVRFIGIASETDNVPDGSQLAHWQAEAKIKFAQEWEDAENWARTQGKPACRAAIAWIADHPEVWIANHPFDIR